MNHHQNKQNQIGEKCLLVRQLHINNEITPSQFVNKNLQTSREKEKQNKQIQDQLNKSQDNLSDVDIDHIKNFDNAVTMVDDFLLENSDVKQDATKPEEEDAPENQKVGRNFLTSQNVHEVMSQYIKSLNDHRNICRIIDYEVFEKQGIENNIFVISESYNLCLFDLYCTFQAEKTILSEDFLIETSFQVLKALEYLNRQGDKTHSFKGFQGGFQGMMRMQNILFDENGCIKLQEMSNLHFDEYEIKENDLIFLPPEVLKGGARRQKGQMVNSKFQLNSSMDIWTLGMILLHCLCLEYKKVEYEDNSFDEILSLYMKVQGPSLITFEEKEDIDQHETRSKKGQETFSENSEEKNLESPQKSSPAKQENWINFYSTNQENKDSQLSKFLSLKMLESANYSPKFMDFLRECLMFDPKERMRACDLLSHPVFRKYNKIYISQQIVMTRPITKVEKHHLQKMRRQLKGVSEENISVNRDMKIRQLLDIIKIKIKYEKRMDFLQFLMQSFNQINQRESEEQASIDQTPKQLKGFNSSLILSQSSQYGIKLLQETKYKKRARIPAFIRIINKEDNSFKQRLKYGANLRFLRQQNFKSKTDGTLDEHCQVSNFLILKSDLNVIKQIKEDCDKLVTNDMKNIIKPGSSNPQVKKEKKIDNNFDDSQSIISDGSSVYSSASSILDSISSIFSVRSAQKLPITQEQKSQKDTKSQKDSGSTVASINQEPAPSNEVDDTEEKIKDYLIFQNFLKKNTAGSTDLTVLRKMVRKYSDILQICKNLRIKVFKRLFNKAHQFDGNIQSFLVKHGEIAKNNQKIMSKQDTIQIKKDIDRINLHPVLKLDVVRSQIQAILYTFIATNKNQSQSMVAASKDGGVSYIQGIDTIASTLYIMGFESQNLQFIDMMPTMLKQIYEEYSRHFLDPETGHLDFRYSSILMTRLLNFFDPELANDMKDIDHSLYLIKWFMTLFAHTLPLKVLHQIIWIDLFCERVDYLFFLALSILIFLKDRLLLQRKVANKNIADPEFDMDGDDGFGLHSLAIIQILSGSLTSIFTNETDINRILNEAREMSNFAPHSFICSDLTFNPFKKDAGSKGLQPLDKLRQNDYFSRRWWELENLDYSSEICIPLISVDDCVELKKNKILIDVRPFGRHQYHVYGITDKEENKYANFLDCHVKNSYYMADTVTLLELSSKNQDNIAYERDLEKLQKISQIQIDFMQAYRENYPNNVIVIVGNKHSFGDKYAQFVVDHANVSKVCLLKGGIDAYRLEYPQLLRKAKSNQQSENDFLVQYERFVKKSLSLKSKRQLKQQQEMAEKQLNQ